MPRFIHDLNGIKVVTHDLNVMDSPILITKWWKYGITPLVATKVTKFTPSLG